MKACRGCGQFVHRSAADCPFCAVAQTCDARLSWVLVCSLGAVACGPAVSTPAGESSGETSSAENSSSSTIDPTTTTASTGTSSTTTMMTTDPSTTVSDEVTTEIDDSSSSETLSGSEAAYGILDPDSGTTNIECDLFAQDCPIGEKCMPWANDGGNAWNATRCTPLDPNAGEIGDACTVEGSGVSGIDDCVMAAMCWHVDPKTNEGTCIGLCEGTEANPTCNVDATICLITNEGVLPLCHTPCDPMMPMCPDGQQCFGVDDAFVCAPG